MTRRSMIVLAVLLALLLPGAYAAAQQGTDATPTPAAAGAAGTPAPGTTATPNPNLQIIWPQPISEVNGTIDVVGIADIPGMAFYRLEAIELNADYTQPENAAWIPLTTDQTTPVTNGTLATVDTTRLPDGLYNLKLSAFTGTVDTPGPETATVAGPVRINNDQPVNANTTPTPPAPIPMTKGGGVPVVVPASGVTAVNVRSCTVVDNNLCPTIDSIPAGGSAQILGISNDGAGWYQVVTTGGNEGWVSSTVVSVIGNTSNIPLVTPPTPLPTPPPPPPPPPAQPTPTPNNQPPAQGWVIPTGIGFQNGVKPQCAQTFNLEVNVGNTGSAVSAPGTLTVQDIHVDDGTVTFTGYGGYPSLNPGANYVVVVPMNIDTYVNSKHEIRASNNYQQVSIRYTLGPGNCGAPAPTPTPQPTKAPPPPSGSVTFGPNQCVFSVKNGAPYYNAPQGQRLGTLDQGGYNAYVGQRVNGKRWYLIKIPPAPGTNVWVREQDIIKVPPSCRGF